MDHSIKGNKYNFIWPLLRWLLRGSTSVAHFGIWCGYDCPVAHPWCSHPLTSGTLKRGQWIDLLHPVLDLLFQYSFTRFAISTFITVFTIPMFLSIYIPGRSFLRLWSSSGVRRFFTSQDPAWLHYDCDQLIIQLQANHDLFFPHAAGFILSETLWFSHILAKTQKQDLEDIWNSKSTSPCDDGGKEGGNW